MCFKFAVLAYFIFNGIIFAKGYSNASANIKVKLVNRSSFSFDNESSNGVVNLWIGGSLNFSDSLKTGFYSGIFAVSLFY
jgi:hypothetical protein